MTNDMNQQLNDNFQKVKVEGQTRVSRLKKIWGAASNETEAELKAGFSVFKTIGKELFGLLKQLLGQKVQTVKTKGTESFFEFKTERQQQVTQQFKDWDQSLNERYGDRYHVAKERFRQFQNWYAHQRELMKQPPHQAQPSQPSAEDVTITVQAEETVA